MADSSSRCPTSTGAQAGACKCQPEHHVVSCGKSSCEARLARNTARRQVAQVQAGCREKDEAKGDGGRPGIQATVLGLKQEEQIETWAGHTGPHAEATGQVDAAFVWEGKYEAGRSVMLVSIDTPKYRSCPHQGGAIGHTVPGLHPSTSLDTPTPLPRWSALYYLPLLLSCYLPRYLDVRDSPVPVLRPSSRLPCRSPSSATANKTIYICNRIRRIAAARLNFRCWSLSSVGVRRSPGKRKKAKMTNSQPMILTETEHKGLAISGPSVAVTSLL